MNPWTKKNPALSLWLSGANAVFGATRNRAKAEMGRQVATASAETTKQIIRFWTGGSVTPQPLTKKRRKSSPKAR